MGAPEQYPGPSTFNFEAEKTFQKRAPQGPLQLLLEKAPKECLSQMPCCFQAGWCLVLQRMRLVFAGHVLRPPGGSYCLQMIALEALLVSKQSFTAEHCMEMAGRQSF